MRVLKADVRQERVAAADATTVGPVRPPWIEALAIALIGALIGAGVVALLSEGFLGQPHLITALTAAACLAIAVVGLDLIYGLADQLHLGQSFPLALAAYGSGVLATNQMLNPVATSLIAIAALFLLSLLVGRIVFQLRGWYFVLASIGLALLAFNIVWALRDITGGDDGMRVVGYHLAGLEAGSRVARFGVAWTGLIISVIAGRMYTRSSRGRIARAVAIDEDLALALGFNPYRVKMEIFALGTSLAAFGGVLYAHTVQFLSPATFGLVLAVELLVAVILLRPGTIFGPVVAIIGLRLVPELLESLQSYLDLVYGLLVVAIVMRLRPPST